MLMPKILRREFLGGTLALVWARNANAWIHGNSATNYFVNSVTGSDSNDGRTVATAWQTITKVNAATLVLGNIVAFCGGQTFAGTLTLSASGSPVAPITFTSYGIGEATISSTGAGFSSDQKQYFTLSNLIFAGNGSTVSSSHGVDIKNSRTDNVQMNNIIVSGVTVHAYGLAGISLAGGTGAGSAGFNNATVTGCTVYDCIGNAVSNNAYSGIVFAGRYGAGLTNPSFTNCLISNCLVHDCPGTTSPANWAVIGITVVGAKGVLVTNCIIHDMAANGSSSSGSGGVGICTFDTENVTIQFSEAYKIHYIVRSNGVGFSLAGGNKNCVIQYCYAHNCDGPGFSCISYNDGSVLSSPSATVRYCIGENNGNNLTGDYKSAGILLENDTSATAVFNAYNNTFYNTDQTAGVTTLVELYMQNAAGCSGHISNNIFYAAGGCKFTATTGPQSTTPTNLVFAGNDWFTNSTTTFVWLGVTYMSFAAWQTASGQEKIAGVNVGLTSDPMLVSPGAGGTVGGYTTAQPSAYMLHIGSPMIGAGLDLNAQFSISPGSQDLYGNTIPRGSLFPVGAYAGPGV
jgi:hypothetical protein